MRGRRTRAESLIIHRFKSLTELVTRGDSGSHVVTAGNSWSPHLDLSSFSPPAAFSAAVGVLAVAVLRREGDVVGRGARRVSRSRERARIGGHRARPGHHGARAERTSDDRSIRL